MLLSKRTIFLALITFVFLFIIFNLLFPQRWLIKLLSSRICPGAVYFQTTEKPLIALTIDDSPDNKTTDRILDTLAKYRVVATFFPLSEEVIKNPKIIERMVKQGHEIGNHLTKDEPSIKLKEKFASELAKAHQTLSHFTTIKWLRPGNGFCDRQMGVTAQKYNYQIALGSVWSYDTHIQSSRFATWFILANTRSGSIIVLHDVGRRGIRTVTTLETIIPKLQKRGYKFVTLSELSDR